MVLIEGRIQTRSWQDNEGNKKYKTEIVGESIQLGPKNTQMPDTTNQLNKEEIPIIQKEEEDIDIKDIPF
jgi:single-strand DNA-binding protein